jgi:hypothetical protein
LVVAAEVPAQPLSMSGSARAVVLMKFLRETEWFIISRFQG